MGADSALNASQETITLGADFAGSIVPKITLRVIAMTDGFAMLAFPEIRSSRFLRLE
jgi:hypothetical protein